MHFYRLVAIVIVGTLAWAQNSRPTPGPQSPSEKPSGPASSGAKSPATSALPAERQSAAERERSGADPLLDLPPLPEGKLTVIGGTVAKLDRVRDRLVLRPFGSKNELKLNFDLRTKITQNGQPATAKDIRPGVRLYADTMLNGDEVFAKNIRIAGEGAQGDARGQFVDYDARNGVLSLREQISPEPVKIKVTPNTKVQISNKDASIAEIRPGALVVINFAAGAGRLGEARNIRVLANPGESFKFVGRITFVDMRSKRFAIANQSDNETYDIAIGPVSSQVSHSLREGRNAVVSAVFNGQTYEARDIELSAPAALDESKN